MADFFDRLAARHDPAAVRLQPRLPGPFERVGSLPDPAPEAESPAAARVPAPVLREREVRRVEREVHRTDRITVVRAESPATEPPPRAEAAPRRDAAEPVARLVPPADVTPAPEPPRPAREHAPGEPEPVRERGGSLRPAAATPAPADSPRTRIAAAAAAPRIAPASRRRPPAPAEPVVRVEIGRLQVGAAAPQRPPDRPRAGRRAPAVNLADYLDERAGS
ncbi:hypothetical protein ABZ805_02955 [Saccharopolyspora sp. NPDC047091]|uniref:hypothetical protein n=1 Tax=Saccharopolyspora sp. NPDC047091 TaxID=3155924 RepID=UPI0033EB3454